MKRILLILAILLLCSTAVQAQYSVSSRKAVKEYEAGQGLLKSDPEKAFDHFRKALKQEPDFSEVHLTMATWYLKNDSLDQAEQHYRHYLGQSSGKQRAWTAIAERDLKSIAYRRDMMAHPVPFTPENMGPAINTADNEYMPTLSADGKLLLFTRRFPRTAQSQTNSPEEEDLYYSRRTEEGWSRAVRMPEPVNSYDNEGSGCLSQDGRMLYFTAWTTDNNAGYGGGCDIYTVYRKQGGWSRRRNVGPAVNTGGWESQPCLSIDGQTLYFVSNRKGGYGGLDIWRCTLIDGQWSNPVNLGPEINTKGDEKCPFISFDDQTLYFSSNGHKGMGDMDLFLSRRIDDSTWGKPQNLGYPINTGADESSIIVSPDGRTAIFSSDKYGGQGKLDLYTFTLPEPVRSEPVAYKEEITDIAPTLEVGKSITLRNVFFQTGKAALLEVSLVELDKVVEMMQQHPTLRIELGGHTDNVGKADFNQRLSEQRAKNVYDYLVSRGIAAGRLSYKGYGATQPVAGNDTPEGRRQNRRTVFTIIEK